MQISREVVQTLNVGAPPVPGDARTNGLIYAELRPEFVEKACADRSDPGSRVR
jgi:hypothetical protein